MVDIIDPVSGPHNPGWANSRLADSEAPVVAIAAQYPDGFNVPPHSHDRAQLIHACSGVVTVTTADGRWLVPSGHALWIPANLLHSVDMTGPVAMHSIYVRAGSMPRLPGGNRVVAPTELMRSLIAEAVRLPESETPTARGNLILALILEEIPYQPERPLGLSFPADPRLASLCHAFLRDPASGAAIDTWASDLGMSRRSFTRFFRAQTGLSLSAWRQQACILAALPRLAAGEPVTGIALDFGYDSAAAFSTMFRRMTGHAPSRYLP